MLGRPYDHFKAIFIRAKLQLALRQHWLFDGEFLNFLDVDRRILWGHV
jgi:hypothetical protein